MNIIISHWSHLRPVPSPPYTNAVYIVAFAPVPWFGDGIALAGSRDRSTVGLTRHLAPFVSWGNKHCKGKSSDWTLIYGECQEPIFGFGNKCLALEAHIQLQFIHSGYQNKWHFEVNFIQNLTRDLYYISYSNRTAFGGFSALLDYISWVTIT